MNTKSVLGISLAAVFAVSLIFAQNAFAGVPMLEASVEPQNKEENRYVYSWNPVEDLPKTSDDVFVEVPIVGFGVAIVTFTNESDVNFTGATIHPPARDNRQHSTGWHPHTGTASVIEGTGGLEFCITSLNSPHAGMQNTRDTFRMSMSSADALNTPDDWENGPSGAITFELVIDDVGDGGNCVGATPELKGGDGWGEGIDQIGPDLPGLKVVIDEIIFGPGVPP